ncbi:hypothetical protein [Haloparvum sedimenti]|uniref:hypothetical protein n=1 Tax=Haloparvum sedimenti TaxID=1678448 RepID=UPI00071E9C12|nr:hypothetical protein [Haloparvum sedimenti]
MSRAVATAVLAGLFVATGTAVGTVGAVTTGWAEATFATGASGDAARFGPIFVAQLYFAASATAMLVAPAVAAPLGLSFGSRAREASDAALVCGVGAFVGGFGFLLAAVGLVVASQGAAAGQAHGLGAALRPAAVSALASGAVGAVAGVVGQRLG